MDTFYLLVLILCFFAVSISCDEESETHLSVSRQKARRRELKRLEEQRKRQNKKKENDNDNPDSNPEFRLEDFDLESERTQDEFDIFDSDIPLADLTEDADDDTVASPKRNKNEDRQPNNRNRHRSRNHRKRNRQDNEEDSTNTEQEESNDRKRKVKANIRNQDEEKDETFTIMPQTQLDEPGDVNATSHNDTNDGRLEILLSKSTESPTAYTRTMHPEDRYRMRERKRQLVMFKTQLRITQELGIENPFRNMSRLDQVDIDNIRDWFNETGSAENPFPQDSDNDNMHESRTLGAYPPACINNISEYEFTNDDEMMTLDDPFPYLHLDFKLSEPVDNHRIVSDTHSATLKLYKINYNETLTPEQNFTDDSNITISVYHISKQKKKKGKARKFPVSWKRIPRNYQGWVNLDVKSAANEMTKRPNRDLGVLVTVQDDNLEYLDPNEIFSPYNCSKAGNKTYASAFALYLAITKILDPEAFANDSRVEAYVGTKYPLFPTLTVVTVMLDKRVSQSHLYTYRGRRSPPQPHDSADARFLAQFPHIARCHRENYTLVLDEERFPNIIYPQKIMMGICIGICDSEEDAGCCQPTKMAPVSMIKISNDSERIEYEERQNMVIDECGCTPRPAYTNDTPKEVSQDIIVS